jgi:hypothetical protein
MNTILTVMTGLAVPLGVLNALGGIVAGVWLAVLGEWGVIGWGIAGLFFSAYGLSFAMLPGLIFAAPSAYFAQRGYKWPFYFFVLLGALYTVAVIAAWCGAVLYFFVIRADSASLIPTLLWSYGAATGPLAFMTQKEQQGGDSAFAAVATTFFAQVGYLAMILMVLLLPATLLDILVVFSFVMLIGVGFQFAIGVKLERERAREASL